MHRHPLDTIVVIEEGRLTCCEQCDMFVMTKALQCGHQNTMACCHGADAKCQCHAIEDAQHSQGIEGTQLGNVRQFKYLGQYLVATDDDWLALHKNLAKACKKWALIPHVLTCEGHSARVSDMFYKAIVQIVLLCGCETWSFTHGMYKVLGCFHHLRGMLVVWNATLR